MPKATKRKPSRRPVPTTAEKLRRDEEQSLRRHVRGEKRIARLARSLSTALHNRESTLVELHAHLDNHLRRVVHGEVDPLKV